MSRETPSPGEVAHEVRRLSGLLEQKARDLPGLFTDAGRAEATYRVEFAKALLSSDCKTVAEREADAQVRTAELLFERKAKEAVADAAKEAARHLSAELNAAQSIGAMVRSEMSLAR